MLFPANPIFFLPEVIDYAETVPTAAVRLARRRRKGLRWWPRDMSLASAFVFNHPSGGGSPCVPSPQSTPSPDVVAAGQGLGVGGGERPSTVVVPGQPPSVMLAKRAVLLPGEKTTKSILHMNRNKEKSQRPPSNILSPPLQHTFANSFNLPTTPLSPHNPTLISPL